MSKTILFVPDLHKRDVDFSSIKGYIDAVDAVQEDIIKYFDECTSDEKYFIQLGDWYDKGYRSTGHVFKDAYYDRKIADAVGGNAYMCLGNHFFLERDANPEMYLIQPSYLYSPKDKAPMEKAVFRTVPKLVIGKIQISFFHFSKTNKSYIQEVDPDIEFHIGVYHDDSVLPSDIRDMAGYHGTTSNDYLNHIYSNVDMAICGHIHTSVGLKNYTLNNGRNIPIVVPGALAITENKEIVKHKSVGCPVITVDDNGDFDMRYEVFSTHMEMLRFYKIAEQRKVEDTLDIMGSAQGEYIAPMAVSLKDFLVKKGYNERDLGRLMNVAPGSTDVFNLWSQFKEDDD